MLSLFPSPGHLSHLLFRARWTIINLCRTCRTWPSCIHPCVRLLPFQSWPKTLQPLPDQLPEEIALTQSVRKKLGFFWLNPILTATSMDGPTWQCPPRTWWAPPSTQHSPPSPTWTASFPLASPQQWPLSVFALLTRFSLNKCFLSVYWENFIFPDCGLDQMFSNQTSSLKSKSPSFCKILSCWVFHQVMQFSGKKWKTSSHVLFDFWKLRADPHFLKV